MRLVLLLVSGLLASCSGQVTEWSEDDKQNIRHFFISRDANQAATALSNSSRGSFSQEEFLTLRRLALAEARLVNDSVLAKAHPDLPERYRNLYQASLEYSINALEKGDNAASIKGSSLHDQWVDWFNAHKSKIRIPK